MMYIFLSSYCRLWSPIDGEFDDYIVNPKSSGYQVICLLSITNEKSMRSCLLEFNPFVFSSITFVTANITVAVTNKQRAAEASIFLFCAPSIILTAILTRQALEQLNQACTASSCLSCRIFNTVLKAFLLMQKTFTLVLHHPSPSPPFPIQVQPKG